MNGTGAVMSANLTTVSVVCVPNAYAVRGTVSGLLAGQTATLTDNGFNPISVSGPSPVGGMPFTFSQTIDGGAVYQVAVSANPTGPYWQTCSVAMGSGTMGNAPVTNVA